MCSASVCLVCVVWMVLLRHGDTCSAGAHAAVHQCTVDWCRTSAARYVVEMPADPLWLAGWPGSSSDAASPACRTAQWIIGVAASRSFQRGQASPGMWVAARGACTAARCGCTSKAASMLRLRQQLRACAGRARPSQQQRRPGQPAPAAQAAATPLLGGSGASSGAARQAGPAAAVVCPGCPSSPRNTCLSQPQYTPG